jgi:serine/threonine-protein kinase
MQICTSCRRLLTAGAGQCPDDGAAAETVDSLPAGARLGQYRIERMLGEGGMGFVYEATHEVLHRRSAIKMLRPELARQSHIVTRFLNEAKAVNVIDHQNIINVYDYGDQHDGSVYFVMEYLAGETLDDVMHRRRPMALPLVVHVFEQVAKALAAAHAKHIVHRDLKPANIFVIARDGNPYFIKLLDFGIAQLRGAGAVHGLTLVGSVMGTPQYMSPEQISGGTVDARTDIWAMGVMMYRAVTGHAAYAGEEFAELADKILNRPLKPARELVDLPPALDQLIAHCLERDPARRCPSAGVLLAGLERVKQEAKLDDEAIAAAIHLDAGAPRDGLPTRPPTQQSLAGSMPRYQDARSKHAQTEAPARRSKLPLYAAISAAVVLAGGAAYAVRRGAPVKELPTPPPPVHANTIASALADGGLPAARALAETQLAAAIDSGRLQEVGFAVDALADTRAAAGVPMLYRALKLDSAELRRRIADTLCALGLPDAAPKLREALATAGSASRVDLAAAMFCLHDADSRGVLVIALGVPATQHVAAKALAAGHDDAGRAVLTDDAHTLTAGGERWRDAQASLLALGDADAKAALAGELSQKDPQRAIGAAAVLARAGDTAARDQLARQAADPDFAARIDAARALAELGDARAYTAIADGLTRPAAKQAALVVCGLLPAGAKPYVKTIADIASDDHEDPRVRMTAEAALLGQAP